MTQIRARLISELERQDGAYIYLSRLGNSKISRLGAPPPRLAEYFRPLAEAGDLKLLLDVLLLTSTKTLIFFDQLLPRLLRELDRAIFGTQEIVGPGLRGRPRWPQTLRERASLRIGPERFVANVPTKNYSIPANRLLKRVLDDSVASAHQVLRAFPSGELHDEIARVRDCAIEAQKNPYLRDVSAIGGYDLATISGARRSRVKGYKAAAELAAARAAVSQDPERAEWSAALTFLEATFFTPIDNDHLFEFFTLVKTLKAIESLPGVTLPSTLSLLTSRRSREVARFDVGPRSLRVFFDQSPVGRGVRGSVYDSLLRAYPSIGFGPMRPDITIVLRDGEGIRRVTFVECKNSMNNDYVVGGVYKVFGYLFDFAEPGPATPILRAVLSVPELQDAPSFGTFVCLANPERPDFSDAVLEQLGLRATLASEIAP